MHVTQVKIADKRENIMAKGWNIVEFSIIAENRNRNAPKNRGKLYYKLDELSVCTTNKEAMKCFCDYLNKLENADEWKTSFEYGSYFWKINGDKIERYTGEKLCETYCDIEFKN